MSRESEVEGQEEGQDGSGTQSVPGVEKEIGRLYELARDGFDAWCYGGASAEEEKALEQLRDIALQLAANARP